MGLFFFPKASRPFFNIKYAFLENDISVPSKIYSFFSNIKGLLTII